MRYSSLATTLAVVLLLGSPFIARGRNVDLSTVPKRDSVQLTIYNSEDLTLVRETRAVTFKKGNNPLQFSWANTLIDPTSVELKFLTHPDQLDVLDTTYPHDKPQVLYWNVKSEFDGEAAVQITYFTSGISWKADYVCVADAAETAMGFEGFVRVYNNSGEEYEGAQVRLVVGTINLVEKIAQLAHVSLQDAEKLGKASPAPRQRALLEALDRMPANEPSDAPAKMPAPKQVVKEGLSEYFIFTIEGVETIRNGWSKRMRSLEGRAVPFKVQYRYRPREYGEQLARLYLLTNDAASKLGTTPLPDGVVRVFRDNGRDGLSFLAAQAVKYVPIGDKVELNLGPDPNVIFELVKLRASRDNLWMRLRGGNVFRRIDDGTGQFEVNSSVAGWDEHEIYSQRVRNYTVRPIEVEVRRTWPGHVVFRGGLKAKLFDYQTPEFTATVAAGKRADLPFEIVRRQGNNAKQNNVTLDEAAVDPP